ncbi:MAG: hypothetical protein QM722_02220 [Piscinibacter sp.]
MNHDDDFDPLLGEPFARAWQRTPADGATRGRLMQRLAASRAAEAGMSTARRRRLSIERPAAGVGVQWLYRADEAGLHAGPASRCARV